MALLHIDSYSDALGRSVRLDAIIPEGKPGPWRTLVLLHGMTDDHSIWQRRTSIERYAEERGMAVIMPGTKLGFYTNTQAGERYFDYVAVELLKICRRMLPKLSARREDTFVAGLSMGGYGALKCALLHPESFSKAAAFSAATDICALKDAPRTQEAWYRDTFGENPEGTENDLFHAARALKKDRPEIFMWCGTEDFLYEMNLRMRDHLKKLGYRLKYTETPGDHLWMYWDREIINAMNWMLGGKEEWEWV